MTNQPAATAPKPTKQKRKDAYIARVTISIPLDMANSESLATAIKAVAGIEKAMPAGAVVKSEASLGKI